MLLNGAPVAVASTGRTDAQNTNREVDLDLLPTELFTKLSVYKSPTAAMLEGGAAGVVDMRTARPFDNPGRNIVHHVAGRARTPSPTSGATAARSSRARRGAATFGILGGFAWCQQQGPHHRLRDHRLDQPQPLRHAEHCGHAQQHGRRQLDDPRHGAGERRQRPHHRRHDRPGLPARATTRASTIRRSTTRSSRASAARMDEYGTQGPRAAAS